jgi:hypothetical protein
MVGRFVATLNAHDKKVEFFKKIDTWIFSALSIEASENKYSAGAYYTTQYRRDLHRTNFAASD